LKNSCKEFLQIKIDFGKEKLFSFLQNYTLVAFALQKDSLFAKQILNSQIKIDYYFIYLIRSNYNEKKLSGI
jgi:hypothetical protein